MSLFLFAVQHVVECCRGRSVKFCCRREIPVLRFDYGVMYVVESSVYGFCRVIKFNRPVQRGRVLPHVALSGGILSIFHEKRTLHFVFPPYAKLGVFAAEGNRTREPSFTAWIGEE
ncbi:unnamed protein product, partial [Ectocarpus sp. 8 AP-2014]